jgi:hypothetical protein
MIFVVSEMLRIQLFLDAANFYARTQYPTIAILNIPTRPQELSIGLLCTPKVIVGRGFRQLFPVQRAKDTKAISAHSLSAKTRGVARAIQG